ncbi:MAG: BamA/TamA family outer membrane protein, partial [Pedobacter sp.]|nr:BamA/TamA family outer membrane protein [Pedobacter sp.]
MALNASIARGQTDIADVFNTVLKRKKPADTTAKPVGSLVLLPTIGYTPSTGFQFGADVSGTRYFGNPATTTLSVFDAYGALSTGGMAILQIKHNIYSSGNKWNLQGNWNLGKTVMLDHGIGTTGGDQGLFTLRYRFLNLNENAYKELFDHFYAGVGISFNYYTKIDNTTQDSTHPESFNAAYSLKNSYPTDGYFANGMVLNFQYNTRDQPYRPYKGIYLNVLLRTNRTWMGSDRNAVQLRTELRKYWSLSAKNPEHVIA